MNYYTKFLLENTKKFWFLAAALGIWSVAIVDAFTAVIRPPGLFNGVFFKWTFLLTLAFIIINLIVVSLKQNRSKADQKQLYLLKTDFEPQRERQIREILQRDPTFTTHCYECTYFNPQKTYCNRDLENKRIKEIRINKILYCLYWAPGSTSN